MAGCSPLIVHFTNQTTGAPASAGYQWELGNGNTSSSSLDASAAAGVQAIYTDPGVYTVTLTASSGTQVSSSTMTITVYAAPTVQFSIQPSTLCANTPVQFTNSSAAGGTPAGGSGGGATNSATITGVLWDFGDGTTLNENTGLNGNTGAVTHSYAGGGLFQVSLTVTNSDGCSASLLQTNAVKVFPPVTSSFISDKRVLCTVTDPVQFTATSTGTAPLSYSWDFGDGNGSTLPNPSHVFGQKGIFTVKLVTTSGDGCQATDSAAAFVDVASFKTDFSLPVAVCQGKLDSFADLSTPHPDSRVWQIDGVAAGSDSILQTGFSTSGPHTIMLTDQFGSCSQAASKPFTVVLPATINFDTAIQLGCNNYTVNFTDLTPGDSDWAWNFNYFPGQYLPPIDYGGPQASTTWNYYFDHTVQLIVKDAKGCIDTAYKSYGYIHPPIVFIQQTADASTYCGGPVIDTFSIINPQGASSVVWNFGDGTTSTDSMPVHTFTAPGEYDITMGFVDNTGCNRGANGLSVLISPPLHGLDFSTNDTVVCAGTQIGFNFNNVYEGNLLFESWDWGDGTGSSFYPFHTYANPGTYTVTLYVNEYACDTVIIKTNYIHVYGSPGGYTGYTTTCDSNRLGVTFGWTPGIVDTLIWNFGDGIIDTTNGQITQLVHTYPATGQYQLQITSPNQVCGLNLQNTVVVLGKGEPILSANSRAACSNENLGVYITNLPYNPSTASNFLLPYRFTYQYADGTTFPNNAFGTFDVTYPYTTETYSTSVSDLNPSETGFRVITTSNPFGCQDTTNFVPLVIGGVSAGYSILSDDHCFQTPVVLMDTSHAIPGDQIASWLWNFGDGTQSSQSGTISHIYTSPGNYTVTLTVKDSSGCSSSTTTTALAPVIVNGVVASFSPSATDVPLNSTILFTNTSNLYGDLNPTLTWNFGDGTIQTNIFEPSHTYTQAGTYTVTLTLGDSTGGCLTTATATITVHDFNYAFQMNPGYVAQGDCPPLAVQFTNTSNSYTSLSWDFGDGSVATNVTSPSHVYTKPGKYFVTLTVTGLGGLVGIYTDSVIVLSPGASFTSANTMTVGTPTGTAICAGQSGQFQASASNATSFTWDFGDGSVGGSSTPMTTHVYDSGGIYTIRLVVTDSLGCSMAADTSIGLDVHPPPVIRIDPEAPVICLGGSVRLTAGGDSSFSSTLWSPASSLDQPASASVVASPSANTLYRILVTDDIGCQNSDSVSVQVIQPFVLTVSPDSANICPGASVNLKASGAVSYLWIDQTQGLSSETVGDPTAKPASDIIYTVVGAGMQGCFADTAQVVFHLYPSPTVDAGPDQQVLVGHNAQLLATGSSDIISWQWTPTEYLSCSDCEQPVVTPMQTEVYTVTVKNAEGCVAADTVLVKVECEQSRVAIPAAFTPNGDGHNDLFVIQGIAEIDHLVIFDRWGAKVFEREHFDPSDPSSCWDGTFKGRPAPTGVYVYFAQMHCPFGGPFSIKGTVVLVR